MSPRHPQVRQGEQRDQLGRVLHQPTETHLGIAELPFDHPKRVLDLGAHLRFGFLDPPFEAIQEAALAMLAVTAELGRDLPDDLPPAAQAAPALLVWRQSLPSIAIAPPDRQSQ